MFKKLVANLPFNPSLITEVKFYTERLKAERAIRSLSFLFIIAAMLLQTFAVIVPPERSLAYSTNHIMNGIQTKTDIILHFLDPNSDVKDIFAAYNITGNDINGLTELPNETIRSNSGGDWWTIGRNSLTSYSKVADIYKQNQKTVMYRDAGTATTADDSYVYNRQLRAWDIINPYNTYQAWRGTSAATGQTFWILKDCGNITWVGNWETPKPTPTPTPEPPTPPAPALDINKTVGNIPGTLKPGDIYTYNIQYRNRVVGSVAENVVIRDKLDVANFDIVNIVSPFATNRTADGTLTINVGTLQGSETYQGIIIKVQLKNPLPRRTTVCNASSLSASNATTVNSENVCVEVITPCIYDPDVPSNDNPNCSEPVVVCKVVDSAVNRTTRKATYTTTVTSSNPATTQVQGYHYDFGDGSPVLVNPSSQLTDSAMHTYKAGKFATKVFVDYTATGVDGTQKTDTCAATIDFEDDKPLEESKSVKNVTQGLEGDAAIKSKVSGGDVLEYTLTLTNAQNYERTGQKLSDYIGDVLDYATLDLEALKAAGGTFDDQQNKVAWSDISIPATSSKQFTFRVTMKNPIPATNRPSATSGDYDCTIDNTFGNLVSMQVNCPAVKGLETLPNTGPGSSLLAMVTITTVVGYFFSRSRLLAKEMDLIRSDYTTTGGM